MMISEDHPPVLSTHQDIVITKKYLLHKVVGLPFSFKFRQYYSSNNQAVNSVEFQVYQEEGKQ